MITNQQNVFFILIIVLFSVCFFVQYSLAATDLSINVIDITFSKEEAMNGDIIRIYVRAFNLGDKDVQGHVLFLDNGKKIADPQPISIKVNTYDDVFVDWVAIAGNHDIQAKIIETNPKDEIEDNNSATKENYFVDSDTDKDNIGDSKDPDDDNDGVLDEQESEIKTDPKNPDTDEDGFNDKIDMFPKDKTEWQDTDQDSIGNNKDADNDNDELIDKDEILVYGTNPLNPDSDSDGLNDKKEIEIETNPIKADSDGDGAIDSKDAYPLDPTKMTAGLLGAVENLFGKDFLYSPYFWIVIAVILVILLILYWRWRRKRRQND